MLIKKIHIISILLAGMLPTLLSSQVSAQVSLVANANNNLNDSLNNTEQTQQMGKASQGKVDYLVSETDALLNEYQGLLKKTEYQKSYNEELRILQTEQVQELARVDQQIKDIVITKQQLLPLLREMVSTLEQFIKLDLPFQREQRLTAVDKLSQLLSASSASISDKYRRVMEMYQAENDYNYDLAVYRDNVTINDENLSVQVLRIGRSNLYLQTMDAKVSAMWSQEDKSWQLLDDKYKLNIRKAMRIASKKAAPELLELPHTSTLNVSSSYIKGGL